MKMMQEPVPSSESCELNESLLQRVSQLQGALAEIERSLQEKHLKCCLFSELGRVDQITPRAASFPYRLILHLQSQRVRNQTSGSGRASSPWYKSVFHITQGIAGSYCHGVHGATAKAFGVSEKLLSDLLNDVAQSHVDGRLKPILAFVKKLTLTPSRMTQADADAVFAAGWDEQALHDAVSVCALFNFMNRLVEGLGIKGDAGYFLKVSKRLSEHGYAILLKLLGS